MCTIGAKILQTGKEYLLFKNRDFARTQFDDALYADDAFGIMGVASWDASGQGEDILSGFAFGFNDTLTCADAFVKHQPGEDNFDKLVQAIVFDCSTVNEAVTCVQERLKDKHYGWCEQRIPLILEIYGK